MREGKIHLKEEGGHRIRDNPRKANTNWKGPYVAAKEVCLRMSRLVTPKEDDYFCNNLRKNYM